MEKAGSSKTSLPIYKNTRNSNPGRRRTVSRLRGRTQRDIALLPSAPRYRK